MVIVYYWCFCTNGKNEKNTEGFQNAPVDIVTLSGNPSGTYLPLGFGNIHFDPVLNLIVIPKNGNENDLIVVDKTSGGPLMDSESLDTNLYVTSATLKNDYDVNSTIRNFIYTPPPAGQATAVEPFSTTTDPATTATDPATTATDPATTATDPATTATDPAATTTDPAATTTDPASTTTDPASTSTGTTATDPAATSTGTTATDPAATETPDNAVAEGSEKWSEYDGNGQLTGETSTNPFADEDKFPIETNEEPTYNVYKFNLDSQEVLEYKTDGNIVCTFLYATKKPYSEESGSANSYGLLIAYNKSNSSLLNITELNKDDTGFHVLHTNMSRTLNFSGNSEDLTAYPKASSPEEKSTFSAVVSKYNEFAALQPITNSVFFDTLTENFVIVDNSSGLENIIIQNIQGEPVTYENKLSTFDHSTISPWTIIDHNNKVILYINPKESTSSKIVVKIISLNIDTLYYSHTKILKKPTDMSKLEKIRDDRAEKNSPKPLAHYIEYSDGNSPNGSWSCLDNSVKYYSHNNEECQVGTYESSGQTTTKDGDVKDCVKQAYSETYDVSMNIPSNHVSDYYKWMWYWKSKKFEEHAGLKDTSDYILKSSVVPPVCPSCPQCPKSGVCGNCGGNGGSGTLTGSSVNNLKLDTNNDGIIDATFNGVNKVISGTIDTAGKAAGQVTDKAGEAAGKVTDKAGEAVGKVADKTGEAVGKVGEGAKSAAGGVFQAGKDAVGNVWDAGKDAAGSIWGEGKNVAGELYDTSGEIYDAASESASGLRNNSGNGGVNGGVNGGANGNLRNNRNVPGGMSYGGSSMGGGVNTYVGAGGEQRVVNPAVSNMNYFGRLPEKGETNFIPITSNFSSFGR